MPAVAQMLQGFRNLFRPPKPLPPITFSSLDPEKQEHFRLVCRRVCLAVGRDYTDEFAEAFYSLYTAFSNAVVEAAYDQKDETVAALNAFRDEAVREAVISGFLSLEEIPVVTKMVWNRVAPDCF